MPELPDAPTATPGGGTCSHERGSHKTILSKDCSDFRTAKKRYFPLAFCRAIAIDVFSYVVSSFPAANDEPYFECAAESQAVLEELMIV